MKGFLQYPSAAAELQTCRLSPVNLYTLSVIKTHQELRATSYNIYLQANNLDTSIHPSQAINERREKNSRSKPAEKPRSQPNPNPNPSKKEAIFPPSVRAAKENEKETRRPSRRTARKDVELRFAKTKRKRKEKRHGEALFLTQSLSISTVIISTNV